jgi:hypothetical protein
MDNEDDEDSLRTTHMDMELWRIHVDMVGHHCPRDDWYGLPVPVMQLLRHHSNTKPYQERINSPIDNDMSCSKCEPGLRTLVDEHHVVKPAHTTWNHFHPSHLITHHAILQSLTPLPTKTFYKE